MLGLVFYQTRSGGRPIERYIQGQDSATRALLLQTLETFCEEFPDVRTVSIKPLRNKIWEMRVRDREALQHRLLYAVVGKDLVVVHAFTKKTQKTPSQEIALAEKRFKEMIQGGNR